MDLLSLSVKNLQQDDFQQLMKKLKSNNQKVRLLAAIKSSRDLKYEKIIKDLGYQGNVSAFYTLKHRLLEDILEFRLHHGKNAIIQTKERIENLRVLLYSPDHQLLQRELKDLLKKCNQYEIYDGVYEVYFIYHLLNFDNQKQRDTYAKLMAEAKHKAELFNNLELRFYKIILDFQDVFYYPDNQITESNLHQLNEVESLNSKLNSNVSNFFYMSSWMAFNLKRKLSGQSLPVESEEWINYLSNLYLSSTVQFHYPNCEFALECLFNKYYMLVGDEERFSSNLNRLEQFASQIKGQKMYENVLFYFLYAKTYDLVIKRHFPLITPYLNEFITEALFESSSNRIKFYYLYLQALGHAYEHNFAKSTAKLLRARTYKPYLSDMSNWIMLENSLLTIMTYILQDDFKMMKYEISLIYRLLPASGPTVPHWKNFMNKMRESISKKNPDRFKYHAIFSEAKESTGSMFLVDLDRFFK